MIYIVSYFFIYSFLGWCTEVVYAAGLTGTFVNRGFLNGPICPIYGFGILLILYLLYPVKDNILYMLLGSLLITSSVELVGGFLLEKIFHQRWWDYSDKPLNLGGYICPLFSLMWGFACLIVVDRIHPLITTLVGWIPQTVSSVLLILFGCLLLTDLTATVKSILKLNKKLEIIDGITAKIRESSDNLGENLANGTIALVQKKEDIEEILAEKKESIEEDFAEMKETQQKALESKKQALSELYKTNKELLEASHFGQKRLLKAFPSLKSIDHKEALEQLKNVLLNGLNLSNETKKNAEPENSRTEK